MSMTGANPSGVCLCGCGGRTNLATQTKPSRGDILGQPVKYLLGHSRRVGQHDYIVTDCDYATPCWIWARSRKPKGYGQLRRAGKTLYAHRVYWERENGPIPEGLELDHLCRQRACCNPAHLELVTSQENTLRGLSTKLTPAQRQEIRVLGLTGTRLRDLAETFGISREYAGQLVRGARHVTSQIR